MSDGLTIRGDNHYCPLAFGVDTYGGCVYDCSYCFCRRLEETWGWKREPVDWSSLEKHLLTLSPRAQGPLASAIRQRKTLRIGNKSDPFPPEEPKVKITRTLMRFLKDCEWSYKLETKGTIWWAHEVYRELLDPKLSVITVSVMIGEDEDGDRFEPYCSSASTRLKCLSEAAAEGFTVGVIAEPFIPGFHTVGQARRFFTHLKELRIPSVNIYNLHLNDWVLKRLATLSVDPERVWEANKDENWRPVLREIIAAAQEVGIELGCPDFFNSGRYIGKANTCCGVSVPNPCNYNFHRWKRTLVDKGRITPEDVVSTWDGVGKRQWPLDAWVSGLPDGYWWPDMGCRLDGEAYVWGSDEMKGGLL